MKIVLAYSGGLDTAVALRWLRDTYDAEVVPFCADIGQAEDFDAIRARARAAGARRIVVEDLRDEFLRDFAFPALRAGAAYEGSYLLAAPLARPLIAKRLVELAHDEGADAVAHGATGKGNDQVRFYSSVVALDPHLPVLAPVIDWDLRSRPAEVEYGIQHGILDGHEESALYSIDTNIWGSSAECGPLDDLGARPDASVYRLTADPVTAADLPEVVSVDFIEGVPTGLDGVPLDPVELVSRLNVIAGRHGVGRIDIVENRLVGIKTRGVYESPAATVLHRAHHELENIVLDRDTLHAKAGIARHYGALVYFGQWFSPLRKAYDGFVDVSRRRVTGHVALELFRGNITVVSRESPFAMYAAEMSSYGIDDAFDHRAGRGFAYVWSMPSRIEAMTAVPQRSGATPS